MIKVKEKRGIIYFLGYVLETWPTDEGKSKDEDIRSSVTQRSQPVIVFLAWIENLNIKELSHNPVAFESNFKDIIQIYEQPLCPLIKRTVFPAMINSQIKQESLVRHDEGHMQNYLPSTILG